MLIRRLLSTTKDKFQYNPNYKFKCGLEIHTQLKTKYKLFSLSETSFNDEPNTKISYFDVGLPGTQPKLNPEALLLALKASIALNCQIQTFSKFDRKHYFYPDQPMGYQITQQYYPIAKDGYLELDPKLDEIEGKIGIERIQLEQDTGKKFGDIIDYNRANTPLIEVITNPDFQNIDQVIAFIKKYQILVRHFEICSGDLETGAIRVDVNISVNDNPRVEIKNLGTTGDITNALKYEYNRQVEELERGKKIVQETKSWDGFVTKTSRSKENMHDYRYVPDSEIPNVYLDERIGDDIKAILPEFPDEILNRLISSPYNLQLQHAKNLLNEPEHLNYYETFFEKLNNPEKANNWMFQELITAFAKLDQEFDVNSISPDDLVKIANLDYSLVTKRLILKEMINSGHSIDNVIKSLNLDSEIPDVNKICEQIISQNPEVVTRIQKGHSNAIQVLIGQAMKITKGKIKADEIKNKLMQLLK
ncbi:PET112 [Candida pseudojiufengensis]|uniref:PET112 n=1 Tax=Candida pseudojiufengensis TaxID=497109 RepID=UPI002224AFEE|nr:PET112 [Candida pseudojiufengensis]KAI5960401.1 PET112 [Candida pseudojiufengensis]